MILFHQAPTANNCAVVVAELSAFQFMSEAVPDHILHHYSRKMAQSSVVVGYYNYFTAVTTSMQQFLIVLMFSFTAPTWCDSQEREHQCEMIEIMENLHQCVPTKSVGSSREIVEKYLFGSDQLISA